MKEKASSGDYVLCRNMVVLTLCAAVLGIGFYVVQLIRLPRCARNDKRTVYVLVWAEETEGGAVSHKWRYFVKRETKQPWKIEKYSRDDPNGEYVLRDTVIVNYPLNEETGEEKISR